MNPKDVGYLAGVMLSLVTAGASLKQQGDETTTSSERITQAKVAMETELNRLRLKLEGYEARDEKSRELLIRMEERLKVIEAAVTKRRYQ